MAVKFLSYSFNFQKAALIAGFAFIEATFSPVTAQELSPQCSAKAVAEIQKGHSFYSSSNFDKPISTVVSQSPALVEGNLVGQYSYRVIARFPHSKKAFTQGLVYYDKVLYESIGKYGRSELRKLDMATGEILGSTRLPSSYFGEGLSVIEGNLVQLTWKSGRAFLYEPETLQKTGEIVLKGERWGGATLDGLLLASDGSPVLNMIDIKSSKVLRSVEVKEHQLPLRGVNEMEVVDGTIFANVWPTECIVQIDPTDGQVINWLDLSKLRPDYLRTGSGSVLNGIAYIEETGHFLVTGKNWPYVYRIEIFKS